MVNEFILNTIRDRVDTAIKNARQASGLAHPGIKGSLRENGLRNLFRPLLTLKEDIGSGIIVDLKGRQSQETDVIIYSRSIHPPIFNDDEDGAGIYPADACLYAIEVKSKATAKEIRDAMGKAKTLRNLEYTPGLSDSFGKPIQHTIIYIIPAFFAFDSDLTGKDRSELDRYLEFDERGDFDPLLRAICVIGKGYWYFNSATDAEGAFKSKWFYVKPTSEHDEVVSFLGGILNTLPAIIASRGHPKLGPYMIPSDGICIRESTFKPKPQ